MKPTTRSPRECDVAPPEGVVHIVVDTNVVKDFYSFHDLMTVAEREGTSERVLRSPAAAYRAARSKDTIMLAWFCHLHRVEARVLMTEALSVLLRDVPPEQNAEPNTALLKAILHFVKDYVLPGWEIVKYVDEPAGLHGNAADDWLISKALSDRLDLITNEGNSMKGIVDRSPKGKLNLRGKAREAGVPVYTPGEYLALKQFDITENGQAFIRSFENERPLFLQGRDDADAANETLGALFGLYRFVLFDEVDEQYRNSPRASWPPAKD